MAIVRVELQIGGMTCASCVGKVEREIAAVPGVEGVAVNLLTESAAFMLDTDRASAAEVCARLAQLGYTSEEKLAEDANARVSMWIAAAHVRSSQALATRAAELLGDAFGRDIDLQATWAGGDARWPCTTQSFTSSCSIGDYAEFCDQPVRH